MYPDCEFVELLLAGDCLAWQEWDRRFRPLLAAIARREFRLGQQDIEDLLQDLALTLLMQEGRQLRAYRGEAPLRRWLSAVWRRRCVDFKRRRRAPSTYPDLPALQPLTMEMHFYVWQALQLVNNRDRVLLRMHFLEDLPHKDIAARLRLSVNAIGPSLSRAKARLRKVATACTEKRIGPA
jgi:RNA polymerase sigma factor (sigma-70 family)